MKTNLIPLSLWLIVICYLMPINIAFCQDEITAIDDSAEYTTIKATQLNNNDIPFELGQQGLDKLYQQFEQHFGDYLGETPKKELNYAFVMGKKSSYTTFKLLFQYFLAMDEGLDVSRFERFGLMKKNKIGYTLSVTQFPHLASPKEIHRFANKKSGYLAYILKPKGFRQSDIDLMVDYSTQYNYDYQEQFEKYQILKTKLPKLAEKLEHKHVYSAKQIRKFSIQMVYALEYTSYAAARNWTIEFIEQFDPQRQRILKQAAIENINAEITGRHAPNVWAKKYHQIIEQGYLQQAFEEYQQRLNTLVSR